MTVVVPLVEAGHSFFTTIVYMPLSHTFFTTGGSASCASTPSIYFLIDNLKSVTDGIGALQLAVVPLNVPTHDQVHGPVPATVEGVPTLQSPVFGFVVVGTP